MNHSQQELSGGTNNRFFVQELLHRLSEDDRERLITEELRSLSADRRAAIVAKQLPTGLSPVPDRNSTVKDLPPEALADLLRSIAEVVCQKS